MSVLDRLQLRNARKIGASKAKIPAVALGLILSCATGTTCGAHDGHRHPASTQQSGASEQIQRSWLSIPPSDTPLVGMDGNERRISDVLAYEGPLYLNFVYTSCTTVCPLMNQVFADLQSNIAKSRHAPHFVSISIDPEHDTPTRLSEYASAIGAGPNWHFYTGSLQSNEAIQRVFGVYETDKMNHRVVTFYRAAKQERWLRLDGFLTPEQLLRETSHYKPAKRYGPTSVKP
jgi:cytochrome oxidase Cu insertion factor (SCO1/SenC/PrrC family)